MEKDDVYITMLKIGKEHTEEGISYSEMRNKLKQADDEFHKQLYIENFTVPNVLKYTFNSDVNYRLNSEGYFRLLEHEELKHARESSLEATNLAKIAMYISATLAIVSILVQLGPYLIKLIR